MSRFVYQLGNLLIKFKGRWEKVPYHCIHRLIDHASIHVKKQYRVVFQAVYPLFLLDGAFYRSITSQKFLLARAANRINLDDR